MVHHPGLSAMCRLIIILFLVVATVCVAVGTRVCATVKYMGSATQACNGDYSITQWSKYSKFNGQYFVFAISILLMFLLLLLIIFSSIMRKMPKILCMVVTIFGALVAVICFGVEVWYATGFDTTDNILIQQMYIESWIAACVFYVLVEIGFIVDTVCTGVFYERE